ncbi:hypothetical protein [Nocardia abscessus]|uniref:hypothetical protein n=1 Tax=Nocardia abscessus TaxID=120957 RepID=UPI0024538E72|nr:hypothetical protein [Nocardia abscessus]
MSDSATQDADRYAPPVGPPRRTAPPGGPPRITAGGGGVKHQHRRPQLDRSSRNHLTGSTSRLHLPTARRQ